MARTNKFKGVQEPRSCTDVLFLCVFILFFLVMVVIGILGFMHGDPYRLVYASDLNGQVCGHDSFGKYIWYTENSVAQATASGSSSSLQGYCVSACPGSNGTSLDLQPLYNDKYPSPPSTATIATKSDFYRCLPSAGSSIITDSDHSTRASIMRQLDGMRHFATPLFVIGFVATPLLAIFYIALLGVCGGCLVWTSLLLLFLLLAAGSAITGCFAQYWSLGTVATQATGDQQFLSATYACNPGEYLKGWKVMFWIFAVMTVVQVLATCCLCSRIRLGIAIIKQTSRAVLSMACSLLLFPLLPLFLFLGFFTYWLFSLSYVYTSTSEAWNATVADVSSQLPTLHTSDDAIQDAIWAYVFWFFWTVEMLMAFAAIVVAGAVGSWYFAGGRADGDRTQASGEVCTSVWTACRYHLGTIALGSLIIAVVRFLRAVLGYIQEKTKHTESQIVKAVLYVLQSCLWCFEKCMRFINKNAYIVCAVEGTSFCPSAARAFELLLANALRVATVSYISTFVLLVGKLGVSLAGLLLGYLWIDATVTVQQREEAVGDIPYGTYLVYVLMWGINYIVAYCIIETYDMAIDTTLMCCLIDEEANEATGEYYAPPDLQKFLDDNADTPLDRGKNDSTQPTVGRTPVALAPGASV